MASTVFFTCANRQYEDFAPLYAAAVLEHVPNSLVEIGLEDAASFERANEQAISILRGTFGAGRLLFRTIPEWKWRGYVRPHAMRFLNQPLLEADYVYIGDIDVIVLEPDLVEQHLAFIARTGLPYSNSVRPNTQRLSGLHFAKYSTWYPLPDVSKVPAQARYSDEKLLYEICRLKGLPIQDQEWFRPVHGIHASPNREPNGKVHESGRRVPGWGISGAYSRAFAAFASQPFMQQLRPLLSDRVQNIFVVLDRTRPRRSSASA